MFAEVLKMIAYFFGLNGNIANANNMQANKLVHTTAESKRNPIKSEWKKSPKEKKLMEPY